MSDAEVKIEKLEDVSKHDAELTDKELDPVAGGWNPQPDPPGRS